MRACCPHYPPKTCGGGNWASRSVPACCPHYPPKTFNSTPNLFAASSACCPHYPPKTVPSGTLISVHALPAVHTIPQKQIHPQRILTDHQSLLSTLSPKNFPYAFVTILLSAACCPHYPPKTGKGQAGGGNTPMPAVHTIPQKPSCNAEINKGFVLPAVHTIPQKPVEADLTARLKRRPAVHTIPQKHVKEYSFVAGAGACCPHYPPKNLSMLVLLVIADKACCPHYPPKTYLCRTQNAQMPQPAVHTIPQKPLAVGVVVMVSRCLLSTLSPKNQQRIIGFALTAASLLSTLSPKNVSD